MPRGKKSDAPRGKKSDTPRAKAPTKTKDDKVVKPSHDGKKKATTSLKAKAPSMFQAVMSGIYGDMIASTQPREGVLLRATAKATHMRKVLDKTLLPCDGEDWAKSHGEQTDFINVFNRKLSKKLRAKIFRLVVVDNAHLIYAGSSTKEQPDLAMTCRAVRREVLDIYYTENTFAIMLEGFRSKKKEKNPPENWLAMMQQAGRLGQIHSWTFADEVKMKSAEESDATMSIRAAKRAVIESVVISLQRQDGSTEAEHEDGTSWKLEVHNDVRCIVSDKSKGRCQVQELPSWVNNIVIDGMHDKADGSTTVQGMLGMLKSFAKQSEKVLELRCEQDAGIKDLFAVPQYLKDAGINEFFDLPKYLESS